MSIILTISVLVIVIIALIIYNFNIQKKIEAFKNINEKVNNLSILQDFMNIVGQEETVDEKLKKINEIILEKYDIKYSTIVVFNGAEYEIKVSNVDEKHHEVLSNLHTHEIFQDSVSSANPKYVTIESENEKLPYQQTEMGRAKSAMFFPLYIDNIYIGYWIIESGQMHAFDNIDVAIIEVIKDNIISIIQATAYQEIIDNTVRIDKFSGLYSAEYLYGEGKRSLAKYSTSAVCMFKITNIEEINEQINRQMGNSFIIEVSNLIKSKLPSQYIFVRYMGPKFIIVFSGVEESSVTDYLSDLKDDIESLEIIQQGVVKSKTKIVDGKEVKVKTKVKDKSASPIINCIISTYYRGTGIEQLTKKLEDYLDNADKSESQINFL